MIGTRAGFTIPWEKEGSQVKWLNVLIGRDGVVTQLQTVLMPADTDLEVFYL